MEKTAEYYNNLGIEAADNQDLPLAETYFKQAIALDENSPHSGHRFSSMLST